MGTTTTRLALFKPDPNPTTGDDVDVSELNDNADRIDAAVGLTICTSGTRPASPWDGQLIYETDSNRFFAWVEGAWSQLVGIVGQIENGGISLVNAGTFDDVFISWVNGDAVARFVIDADGRLNFGGGAVSRDTNLYRSAADTLKTDDSLIVAGPVLTTPGGGSVSKTPGVGTVVANTTTLTALASFTIPANQPIVNSSVYKIHVCCRASVTGTPTLTVRSRIGGTATTAAPIVITASSGVTDHSLCIEATLAFTTVGSGGVARVTTTVTETLSVAGSGPFTAVVRQDLPSQMTALNTTTGTLVFDVTVQWSAASASNTITVIAAEVGRVA